MSSATDVEAGVSANHIKLPARPKLHIDVGAARISNRTEDQKMHLANEKLNMDSASLAETIPLVSQSTAAPPSSPPPRGRQPPLAESEAEDIDTPATTVDIDVSGNQELVKIEDSEKQYPDSDDVDSAGHLSRDEDLRSNGNAGRAQDGEDGKLHDIDEVDYFGDPRGAHYGIESRFGERPMSAMEFEAQRSIPDVNVYQQKKNLAQGMMDLALLSANANQLRYVLESSDNHPYYWPSMVFISMSIIIQVFVGVGLIMNSTYNVKNEDDICKADKINNFTVLGIFLVTIVNVFITAFSVAQKSLPAGQ